VGILRSGVSTVRKCSAASRSMNADPNDGGPIASKGHRAEVPLARIFPVIGPIQARFILLGLSIVGGMHLYLFDSINLALPDMAGSLGISSDESSWLLTTYSSFLFLGVPVSIWFAQHVGYKRYLIGSTALYGLASVACIFAPSFRAMLACMALLGFSGAGLTVWWRGAIYVLWPKTRWGYALPRVGLGLFISIAAGLFFSGLIVDAFGWRLIFLPCAGFSAAAIILLALHFPRLARPGQDRVVRADALGIVLLAAGLLSLQVVLSRGVIEDWFSSSSIRLLCLTSATSLGTFVLWQLSPVNRTPLVSLQLLRERHVIAAVTIGVCTGMVLSGSLFVLPQFLRATAAIPHSAGQTGRILCLYAIAGMALQQAASFVLKRIGPRKTALLSFICLISCMALLWRDLTRNSPDYEFVLPLILYGATLATLLPAIGIGVVGRVEEAELLDGVSFYMTFRQFGASLGIALVAILLEHRQTLHTSRLFEHIRLDSPEVANWVTTSRGGLVARAGLSPFDAGRAAVGLLRQITRGQAFVLSYADAFLFMGVIGVVGMLLIPIMSPMPRPVSTAKHK
jgi:DHA2 family multidrug resistance protein